MEPSFLGAAEHSGCSQHRQSLRAVKLPRSNLPFRSLTWAMCTDCQALPNASCLYCTVSISMQMRTHRMHLDAVLLEDLFIT